VWTFHLNLRNSLLDNFEVELLLEQVFRAAEVPEFWELSNPPALHTSLL
jgi:hypothetical protein